jgi:hypothetical protein
MRVSRAIPEAIASRPRARWSPALRR